MRNHDISSEPEELLEGLPETQGALLEYVDGLVGEAELERAREVLDRALEAAPTPALRTAQTRICLETGDIGRARSALAPLRSSEQPDAEVLVLSARTAARTGDVHTARRELERAAAAGAPEETLERLGAWLSELGGDTVEQEAASTAERDDTTSPTVEVDADFESLVEASDAQSPGSVPDDIRRTERTEAAESEPEPFEDVADTDLSESPAALSDESEEVAPPFETAEQDEPAEAAPEPPAEESGESTEESGDAEFVEATLLEESEGVDSEDNPFEEADDTVLDDSGPPEGTDGEPPSTRPVEDEKIGRSMENADPNFYGEAESTEFDADVAPKHAGDDSDVFQLSTDPSSSGLQLDDLLVDQPLDADSEEEEDDEGFRELETNPVHEYAEDRDDFQIAEPEPTQLIDLDDPGAESSPSERSGRSLQNGKMESGMTDAEDRRATTDRRTDDSESTIEIDEALQPDGIEAAIADAPTGPMEDDPGEFEAATDPEVPGAQVEAGVRKGTPGTEAPTDPEVPTNRDFDRQIESEIPTDPQNPKPGSSRSEETSNERPGGRQESGAGARHPQGGRRPEGPGAGRDRGAERGRGGAQGRNAGRQRREPDRRRGDGPRRAEDSGAAGPPPNAAESGEVGGRRRRGGRAPDGSRAPPPQTAPGPGFLERLRGMLPLPDGLNSRGFVLVASVTLLSFAVALLFVAGVTTKYDARGLHSTLNQIRTARSTDTYRGWSESLKAAEERASQPPGAIRQFMYAIGGILPGDEPPRLMDRIRWEYAYTAAVVEYRFEAPGSREAAEVADRIFDDDSSAPMAAAAETYRLLGRGRASAAVDRARRGHKAHPNHRPLESAFLEALLQAQKAGEIEREARNIRQNRDQLTVYERYLLARAAAYGEDSSEALLEKLVEDYSPDHLDARIARVRTYISRGDFDRATSMGRRLIEEHADSAAPYQIARLRIALGDAYRANEESARAEEQYRRAIEAQPERTSVYLPLTDLFVGDGRLDEARRQVESARSRAGETPDLRVRSARLEFLRGKFESALEKLGGDVEASVESPVLRGRILMELGNYEEARTVLNSLSSSHSRYPEAKALELVARARMGVADDKMVLEEIEKLRADRPESPIVLRSAARIRLHFARSSSGRDRRRHLDKAREFLSEAVDAQPDRALHYYLLCECHLLADRASEAAEACRTAEEKNSKYLPGLSTLARLRLRQGEISRADSLVSRLSKQFDRRWDVAALRIRTAIRNHEAETAREILDEWLQRPVSDEAEFKLFEGLVAFARGDYAQAVGYFGKARDSSRHNKEASLYYAHSLARLGKLDRAEEIVRRLTRSRRWEAAGWLVFGEVRRRQGREDDALENLGLAEDHYESDFAPPWRIAHLYAERALVWRDLEDWDDPRVLENLQRGKERGDSESPEIQLAYGRYFFEGPDPDLERAATHFEKVVDLQPYRCRAVRALVEIYRELRERKELDRIEELAEENCD